MAVKIFTGKRKGIKFEDALEMIYQLNQELQLCEPRSLNDLSNVPGAGVYVLYERGKAFYVGRSNRIKDRLKEHGRRSSSHYSASFAYNIAKVKAIGELPHLNGLSRKAICADESFKEIFQLSKQRVSNMKYKAVQIVEPDLQALFEIYAAMNLNAKWTIFTNS